MNGIWFFLLLAGFVCAVITGRVAEFSAGAFNSAQTAVELALKLAGIIVFWLGLMKIAEKSGLVSLLARAVHPVLKLLFPEVPKDHPALPAIAMNIAANAVGLDNAATPLGIKAMEELEKLNPKQGVLSDAQALLVAINTAGVSVLPVTVISLRIAEKSKDPYEIVGPTLLATALSMVVAVGVTRLLAKTRRYRAQYESAPDKPVAPLPAAVPEQAR